MTTERTIKQGVHIDDLRMLPITEEQHSPTGGARVWLMHCQKCGSLVKLTVTEILALTEPCDYSGNHAPTLPDEDA